MLREIKRLANPWLLARQNQQFSGQVSVAKMPRLVEQLASGQGEISFSIRFRNDPASLGLAAGDDSESARAEVSVSGQVMMTCQRSLQDFSVPIEHASQLAFFADEGAMQRCPEDCEPVLVEGDQLALIQLIEDEMILALPVVAINPAASLPAQAGAAAHPGAASRPEPEAAAASAEQAAGNAASNDAGNDSGSDAGNEHARDESASDDDAPDGSQQTQRPFSDLARLLRDEKLKEK